MNLTRREALRLILSATAAGIIAQAWEEAKALVDRLDSEDNRACQAPSIP